MNQAFILISHFILASSTMARTFTIKNNCPFTIWPAHFTNPDSPIKFCGIVKTNKERFLNCFIFICLLSCGTARLNSQPAGWEAQAYAEFRFYVPDRWAGRFWGRRNCDFSRPGPTSCLTGGCNGGLVCDSASGTGVPPATLAEFKLNGDGGQDFYDVSNVDGSNLPVRISNNKGCPTPSCGVDLNPGCPDDRMKVRDQNGITIGCLSACQANLDGNHGNSGNCCTGSHSTPNTCPKQGVQFYNFFKSQCPDAYAYAYDESSQSALWTCNRQADYTVTFCP